MDGVAEIVDDKRGRSGGSARRRISSEEQAMLNLFERLLGRKMRNEPSPPTPPYAQHLFSPREDDLNGNGQPLQSGSLHDTVEMSEVNGAGEESAESPDQRKAATPQCALEELISELDKEIDQGQWARAFKRVGPALEEFPSNAELLARSVLAAIRVQRFDDALLYAERLRHFAPDDLRGYWDAIGIMRRLGKHTEASELAIQAASKFPGEARVVGEGAWGYMYREDWEGMARLAADLRTMDPTDEKGFSHGVHAARKLGNFAEAVRIANEACEAFPDRQRVFVQASWLLLQTGNAYDALQRAELVRQRFPDVMEGYTIGVLALRRLGRESDAERLLMEGRSLFPDLLKVDRAKLEKSASEGLDPAINLVTSLEQSYADAKRLLTSSSPAFLARLGGSDTDAVVKYLAAKSRLSKAEIITFARENVRLLEEYNGFYDVDNREGETFVRFCEVMLASYRACSDFTVCGRRYLSCFLPASLHDKYLVENPAEANDMKSFVNSLISSQKRLSLYSYSFIERVVRGNHTLFRLLGDLTQGKKVLVVSPFSESIHANFPNRHRLFTNFDYPEFTLLTYTTPITYSGLPVEAYPDRSWFDTVERMKGEIGQLEFDMALLSCGSYAMPLGVYIRDHMKSHAVYVGGVLQLFFGILGRRYEGLGAADQINREHFIYPVERERFLKHVQLSSDAPKEAFGAYF